MKNQDNSFYKSFEEKYNQNFRKIFQPDEELRLKMYNDYRKTVFLRFLPALLAIIAIMTIIYKCSIVLYLVLFCIISFLILMWHNILLLAFFFAIGCILCILTGNTRIDLTATDIDNYLLFLLSILGPLILYTKLFLNYRKKQNKDFTDILKKKHRKELLSVFDNIEWLTNKPTVTKTDLKASDLFMDFDTRIDDDGYKGNYKGISFRISEASLYSELKFNNKFKIFQGVVINFEINKTVKSKTVVSTKKNKISKDIQLPILILTILYFLSGFWDKGTFGKAFAMLLILVFIIFPILYSIYNKKSQKVVLEDSKFNKIFNAYSSDQVEARYLLTTSFMERFKNLQSAFGAKVVKCSFYDDNKLMIAISTNKNLFEIGSLYKSVYDKNFMKQFYRELSSIYYLIDYFKLDEKTGL